jgi:hypothetical protein
MFISPFEDLFPKKAESHLKGHTLFRILWQKELSPPCRLNQPPDEKDQTENQEDPEGHDHNHAGLACSPAIDH